jgi:fructose-1,6-bisphosphatase II
VRITGDGTLCQCEAFAAVTERAALASGRWLGRGDVEGAGEAATSGMLAALELMPITGKVVIGVGDDSGPLTVGTEIGAGGQQVDLAVDPLEGPSVVARGGYGAMAMIAVGDPGTLPRLPQMYMRKMAVGPQARGQIDLRSPVADNVRDLVEELRESGARIKLIQDGDVTSSISAAIRGTNDHLAIGIGGARQAAITAAALRCLGGELQAQFWPVSRGEIGQAKEAGYDDIEKVFTTEELAPSEVIVAATGVSSGDLLRGVRYLADSARTNSLVMCTRCNWVRFVDGIHFFARERREEVRLLG